MAAIRVAEHWPSRVGIGAPDAAPAATRLIAMASAWVINFLMLPVRLKFFRKSV